MNFREAALLLFLRNTTENYEIQTYDQMRSVLRNQIKCSGQYLLENQAEIQNEIDNLFKERNKNSLQNEDSINSGKKVFKGKQIKQ